MGMRAAQLTQAYLYRIDGAEGAPDRRWHYIGSIDGEARFNDGQGSAVMLDLDHLVEIGPGRLRYKPT
jgi:hypothetical protein